jgi:N-acetyl-anhydromuramyl-L-alanine amidase AmpD
MRIDWAAQVLREAGLTVVEEAGWGTRGREFTTSPRGIILHHDVSSPGHIPAHPNVIINGRPASPGVKALAGPLSQWYLNRRGVWHVVAAGKANHAGEGSWNGLTSGNSMLLGIEAANNGTGEVWPEVQVASYARGVAAILNQMSAPSLMALGHKEWTRRKIDPSFDMDEFRTRVVRDMNEVTPRYPGVPQQRLPACRGTAPRWIRQQLVRLGYQVTVGDTFDESTERAVKAFRKRLGAREEGVVDTWTWDQLAMAR